MRERELIVGVAGPFSGPRAAFGELLKNSCVHATRSSSLRIIFHDDMADASQARSVARTLVRQGADIVVGHFSSECAHAAAELYEKAGIPLLLPAATHPGLTSNRVSYRLCANDLKQIDVIAGVVKTEDDGGAAIWSDGSAYAERLRELLTNTLPGLPEVVAMHANGNDPAMVICLGAYHRVSAFIRSVADRRPDTRFICSDDCAIAAFADSLDGQRNVRVAVPVPNFARCAELAFELIEQFASDGNSDFCNWLDQTGRFEAREARCAKFGIEPLGTIYSQDWEAISAI